MYPHCTVLYFSFPFTCPHSACIYDSACLTIIRVPLNRDQGVKGSVCRQGGGRVRGVMAGTTLLLATWQRRPRGVAPPHFIIRQASRPFFTFIQFQIMLYILTQAFICWSTNGPSYCFLAFNHRLFFHVVIFQFRKRMHPLFSSTVQYSKVNFAHCFLYSLLPPPSPRYEISFLRGKYEASRLMLICWKTTPACWGLPSLHLLSLPLACFHAPAVLQNIMNSHSWAPKRKFFPSFFIFTLRVFPVPP